MPPAPIGVRISFDPKTGSGRERHGSFNDFILEVSAKVMGNRRPGEMSLREGSATFRPVTRLAIRIAGNRVNLKGA